MRINTLKVNVSLLAIITTPAPLLAQSAHEESTPAGSAGEPSVGMEDIIVTARKRAERLIDIPVSVSAMSGEQLARYGTSDLAAIAQQTPQLVIGEAQTGAGGVINLRGVGAGPSNPSTDQAVSINVDGVAIGQGNVLRLGQFDLERVEVLKGPQALFYGKNSPGGIISLISKEPGPNFEARLRSGYEFTADQRFFEAIASGPLGGGFGARLVGYVSQQDGWFRNQVIPIPGLTTGAPKSRAPDQTEVFLRGTLTYASPDDRFTAMLKVNYGDLDRDHIGITAGNQQYVCPFGAPQLGLGSIDCKLDRNFTSPAVVPALGALSPSFGSHYFFNSRQFLPVLSMDYNLNDALKLSSVTGYYRIHEKYYDSFSGTNIPLLAASDLVNRSFSQELRLASDYDGMLNFLIGGYYQKGRFDYRNAVAIFAPDGTPGFTPTQPVSGFSYLVTPDETFRQTTDAWSVFGQLRVKPFAGVELDAGGRYSRENKNLKGTLFGLPFQIANAKRKFSNFSPEITLSYKPSRDMTFYASYRRGFTSGGFNTNQNFGLRTAATPTAPLVDLSFNQTTVQGGEAGVKGYVFDRQLRFDFDGYYYKFKDLQLSSFDPVTLSQVVQSAGSSKVRGLELTTTYAPNGVPGLEIRANGAYNKANYTSFIGGCYIGQTPAQGCNLDPLDPSSPATAGTAANPYNSQNQSGQQLVRAPKWSLSGGFSYEHQLTASLASSISVDAFYTGGSSPDVEARPAARQKGYWMFNGSWSIYGGEDRGWKLALIGRNLTNRLVAVTGGGSPFTGGGTGTTSAVPGDAFSSVLPPRSVMLELTLKSSLLK